MNFNEKAARAKSRLYEKAFLLAPHDQLAKHLSFIFRSVLFFKHANILKQFIVLFMSKGCMSTYY